MKTTTYIGTPAEVKRLTTEILTATAQAAEGQRTYLQLLVGTTIHELGAKPAKQEHRGRQPKLSPEGIQAQLAALEAVNERFYAAVLEAAADGIPRGKAAAKELNRRTNFARSAVSTLRGYIRAGNDITKLVVGKVTKRSVTVERAVRPPSLPRLRKRLETRSVALVSAVLELAERDKPAALGELELLMGQLAAQIVELGGTIEREPERAPSPPAIEPTGAHPVRMGGRLFVPVTDTHVERQRARPS